MFNPLNETLELKSAIFVQRNAKAEIPPFVGWIIRHSEIQNPVEPKLKDDFDPYHHCPNKLICYCQS
jgi:hypothetical protein